MNENVAHIKLTKCAMPEAIQKSFPEEDKDILVVFTDELYRTVTTMQAPAPWPEPDPPKEKDASNEK